MSAAFDSPETLIHGIKARVAAAQEQLLDRCRPLIQDLLERHKRRHPEVVATVPMANAMEPWLIQHIRALSDVEVDRYSDIGDDPGSLQPQAASESNTLAQRRWRVFYAAVLASIRRLLLWEPALPASPKQRSQFHMAGDELRGGPPSPSDDSPQPYDSEFVDEKSGYQVRIYYRPHDRVGGDWAVAAADNEHHLWTMIADTTGHSWPAYLLKQCVFLVWRDMLAGRHCDPDEWLQDLDNRLAEADCLPDGIYIESTVGKYSPQGRVVFSSAGAGYLVAHRQQYLEATFEVLSGGLYLGVGIPMPRDRHERCMKLSDELMTATDCLAEQPTADGRLDSRLKDLLNAKPLEPSMHDAVIGILEETWQSHAQHDDATLLTVRRIGSPLPQSARSRTGETSDPPREK